MILSFHHILYLTSRLRFAALGSIRLTQRCVVSPKPRCVVIESSIASIESPHNVDMWISSGFLLGGLLKMLRVLFAIGQSRSRSAAVPFQHPHQCQPRIYNKRLWFLARAPCAFALRKAEQGAGTHAWLRGTKDCYERNITIYAAILEWI